MRIQKLQRAGGVDEPGAEEGGPVLPSPGMRNIQQKQDTLKAGGGLASGIPRGGVSRNIQREATNTKESTIRNSTIRKTKINEDIEEVAERQHELDPPPTDEAKFAQRHPSVDH